ncbi:hypothetical protein GOP47_0015879 [Adiantum capillus-veneris]|uniref:Uncharacterized protein n=1 Tax=Adiantum capillus-veneris TaxID=13818 RepID=A0A9D4ZBL9_ADICA|nr:hypothetical protein GOP47_0015879 [Adiantum capillus-veneris]
MIAREEKWHRGEEELKKLYAKTFLNTGVLKCSDSQGPPSIGILKCISDPTPSFDRGSEMLQGSFLHREIQGLWKATKCEAFRNVLELQWLAGLFWVGIVECSKSSTIDVLLCYAL